MRMKLICALGCSLLVVAAALAGDPPRPWALTSQATPSARCVCGVNCTCPPGVCPDCPATALTYEQTWDQVRLTGSGVLHIGVPAAGRRVGYVQDLDGFRPGVYDCFLGRGGTQLMQRRPDAPTSPPAAAGLSLDACPNGKCPAQSRWR
ncbi:MAG: hypothetical protein JWO38_4864 [Gemmataceae bacterium]|nr:hypothetical protein [Gemmataceae bacterium]